MTINNQRTLKWKKSSEKVELNEGRQNELHLYVSSRNHINYDVSLLKNTRGTLNYSEKIYAGQRKMYLNNNKLYTVIVERVSMYSNAHQSIATII